MTDQLADKTQTPTPRAPPTLSPWVTAVCGLLSAVYLGFAMWTNPASPLDRLEQPEESLERLASREMDLREALEEAPAWKRGLYTAFTGGEETLTDAIGWYDELLG